MVLGGVTVTVADPYMLVFCVDAAKMIAVPAPAGVKTPALLTVPMLAGTTVQLTAELKFPVPLTTGVQVEV
jgi:hypothetical protein